MNFLGLDGWPAPTMKEVADLELQKQKKMQQYYCEVVVMMRRMYRCAQLVHGDLSEYNLLLVPSEQVRAQVSSSEGGGGGGDGGGGDVDLEGEDALVVGQKRVVLIDMGQAVSIHHPDASRLLQRDCARVNSFFKAKGANVLEGEEKGGGGGGGRLADFVKKGIVVEEEEEEEEEEGEENGKGWVDVEGEEEVVVVVEIEKKAGTGGEKLGEEEEEEEGWTTISEAGTIDDKSATMSDTTAAKRSKWRHRAAGLKDNAVFQELVQLLGEQKERR